MDYLVTFLEGIVTFVSPCLLPILPVYLAFFAGGSQGAADGSAQAGGQVMDAPTPPPARPCRRDGQAGLFGALAFVAGFGLVFTLLGAFAGSLGSLVVRHRRALDVACGAVMVALGLNYLGILLVPALGRTLRPLDVAPGRGLVGSFAFGVAFAVGWSPCVGTFLASALSLAASSASAARGIALLVCYSLGLGLPFVLAAMFVERLAGAFAWVKAHYRVIDRACGTFLVLTGVFLATGTLGTLLARLAA